jgi:hypothetical protein
MKYRWKTWLFILSILTLIIGPLAVVGLNRLLDVILQNNATISAQPAHSEGDKGPIRTPRNLVYAAYIFQHGTCPDHYSLGNRLAQVAMESGYKEAKWIYAATFDRYLMSLNELQRFGTQYTWINGEFTLYPVDPETTDAERALYNVPPLSESMRNRPSTSSGSIASHHWLESWWLTLIGACFAVLGAFIALANPGPNITKGRLYLIFAIVIYAVSVLGHVVQSRAFVQGNYEAQQILWKTIDWLMIAIWLGSTVREVSLWKKSNRVSD